MIFTNALTSASLACISAILFFIALYLYEICSLTTSSPLAFRSMDSSSTNLYSMFWMKSSRAEPSRFMTSTARCECGCLMQLSRFLTITLGYSAKSTIVFSPCCSFLKPAMSSSWT